MSLGSGDPLATAQLRRVKPRRTFALRVSICLLLHVSALAQTRVLFTAEPKPVNLTKITQEAQAGSPTAQFLLGRCYHTGQGVSRDVAEAIRWYRMAAEHGETAAQVNLGILHIVSGDCREALKWLQRAAADGSAPAAYNLAVLFMNGCGAASSEQEALAWYRRAADKGFAPAFSAIGDLYKAGRSAARGQRL